MRMRADLHVSADEKVDFSIHRYADADLYAVVRFGLYSDGSVSIFADSPECLRKIARVCEDAASELERAR